MRTMGYEVRELRQSLGQTQVQFAAMLGVTQRTVCFWEKSALVPKTATLLLDRFEQEGKAFQAKPLLPGRPSLNSANRARLDALPKGNLTGKELRVVADRYGGQACFEKMAGFEPKALGYWLAKGDEPIALVIQNHIREAMKNLPKLT
jgi:DNA-binding XRE family transcriptional regulator